MISSDAPLKISSKDAPVSNAAPYSAAAKPASNKQSDGSDLLTATSRSKQPLDVNNDSAASSLETPSNKEDEKKISKILHEIPSTLPPHSSALLHLARPSAPRNSHQPDTKCMVKVSYCNFPH